MSQWYILDANRNPVPVPLAEGARAFEQDRRVARTMVNGYEVSTVFLGMDHRPEGEPGPPLVFETMVFLEGERTDLYCQRYSTWLDAEEGHNLVVAMYGPPSDTGPDGEQYGDLT